MGDGRRLLGYVAGWSEVLAATAAWPSSGRRHNQVYYSVLDLIEILLFVGLFTGLSRAVLQKS
jgi:hypothetical protein